MDIDKPVVVCIECGAVVGAAWELYCDKCYRKFVRESANIVRKSVGVSSRRVGAAASDAVSHDDHVLYGKHGVHYEFNGHAWVKRSGKSDG